MSVIDNWKDIVTVAAPFLTFFAGRKATKLLEKKQQVDAIDTMQKTYDTFLMHYNNQYQKLTDQIDKLQKAFVDLQLAYAKEIETSQNWEKLHRKLEEQYKMLEKKYSILETQYKESEIRYKDLEKLYNKLKTDFENHKKDMR